MDDFKTGPVAVSAIKLQIEACEEQLKQAMLQSDVSALDALLSSDLVFTNHLGKLMSKQDDLNAHQSGVIKINEIILSDQNIEIYDAVAIVTVRAHISGNFSGIESKNVFRFTRVWGQYNNKTWRVIAGHSTIEAL